MMATIKIFTGPTTSGKTTRLMNWASTQKNIDGIFQPVVENKRFIYHMGSRTLKLLEANESNTSDKIVEIGKYKFSNTTFEWAKDVLLKSFNEKLNWLIIDEVGQLEILGKGLEPVIGKIIKGYDKFSGNIVFVVKESLLKKFKEKFKLQNNFEMFEI